MSRPVQVFVLCTGRCGSQTFYHACRHITNFTAGHETRVDQLGPDRLSYPVNHIEVDNRLAWMLGRLDEAYGDNAFYVHLTRDRMETARSYARRYFPGYLIHAYAHGILMNRAPGTDPLEYSLDCCDTINANIRAFLKDKSQKMNFQLENAERDFAEFWRRIGAEGDFAAAMCEWKVRHGARVENPPVPSLLARLGGKLVRLLKP